MRAVVSVLALIILPLSLLAQDGAQPGEIQFQVEFKPKARIPHLSKYGVSISGTCSLPDGMLLRVGVSRKSDRVSDTGELVDRRGRGEDDTVYLRK